MQQNNYKKTNPMSHHVRILATPGSTCRGGNGRTNGWMENLPILQDFVPYWGRFPASLMKTKKKVEQGK